MQETLVRFLDWGNPLEEGMATHSSVLAWRIPVDGGAWWAAVHEVAESDMTEWISLAELIYNDVLVSGQQQSDLVTHIHLSILFRFFFFYRLLEKNLESPLDSMEIKPVNPKGNQPWIFIGRTDAEAEAATLWPPDGKSWLIRKGPDAGKGLRQEAKGTTEDEMVGWHHQLNGYEFEQTPGDSEGQGSLVCCNPCSHKQEDMTEQLNKNNNLILTDSIKKDPISFWGYILRLWGWGHSTFLGVSWSYC